jgi:hypothetical protein
MKEYNDGRDYVQEFWKLAITSQIGVLDTMANALDNIPKEMQGDCLREMYKSNTAFFAMYVRTIEQAGGQAFEMQSDALKRASNALKTVLSRMGPGGTPTEPEASPR